MLRAGSPGGGAAAASFTPSSARCSSRSCMIACHEVSPVFTAA